MAKTVNTGINEPDPLITLKEEALKELEGLAPLIESSYADLDTMEELGIDSSRLREKVDWAAKAQALILKRMSKK